MTIIRHPLKSLAELADSRQRTSGFTSTDRMLVQDETVTKSKWFRPSLLAQNTINLLGTQHSSILATGDKIAVQPSGQTVTKYASPSLLASGLIGLISSNRTTPALDSQDYFAVQRVGDGETKHCSASMLAALASVADGSITTAKVANGSITTAKLDTAAAAKVQDDSTTSSGSLATHPSFTTLKSSYVYLASADLPAVIVVFASISSMVGTGVQGGQTNDLYSKLLINGTQYGILTKGPTVYAAYGDSSASYGCPHFHVGVYYTASSAGNKTITLYGAHSHYDSASWAGADIVSIVLKNTSLT